MTRVSRVGIVVGLLVGLIAIGFLLGTLSVRPVRVVGGSMSPTLEPGQLVWTMRYPGWSVRSGQVVVAQVEGQWVIKRVESVHYERVQLVGDNPRTSHDSRTFGPVRTDQIVGFVIWPPLSAPREADAHPVGTPAGR